MREHERADHDRRPSPRAPQTAAAPLRVLHGTLGNRALAARLQRSFTVNGHPLNAEQRAFYRDHLAGADLAAFDQEADDASQERDVDTWLAARTVLDAGTVYRVSGLRPPELRPSFGAAEGTAIYAAVFPANTPGGDIQTTLQGFSQQHMGAFLYRFPAPGALTFGKIIPKPYWKGAVRGGQEVTLMDPVDLAVVEIKVGSAWRRATELGAKLT